MTISCIFLSLLTPGETSAGPQNILFPEGHSQYALTTSRKIRLLCSTETSCRYLKELIDFVVDHFRAKKRPNFRDTLTVITDIELHIFVSGMYHAI